MKKNSSHPILRYFNFQSKMEMKGRNSSKYVLMWPFFYYKTKEETQRKNGCCCSHHAARVIFQEQQLTKGLCRCLGRSLSKHKNLEITFTDSYQLLKWMHWLECDTQSSLVGKFDWLIRANEQTTYISGTVLVSVVKATWSLCEFTWQVDIQKAFVWFKL